MPGPTDFAKMVPGFDFLQGLMKGAGAGLPSIGQWVAPTLDPEEIDKRIEQLKTVQFWLEQNAKMLAATIQALEVQRMTLATLKSMNLPMADLRKSLEITPPEPAPRKAPAAKAEKSTKEAPPVVDPMQWWGALTQQFTELASNAMKDSAADAAKNLAGAMVKQGIDAAGETLRKVAGAPAKAAKAANAASKRKAAAKRSTG